jgi:glycosyltransferase involved in cell wall biosynthesis
MKRVLIISSSFYPFSSVGAIRPTKFAGLLPEFGWQPVVITRAVQGADPEEIDVPVYRALAPDLASLYGLGRRLFPTRRRLSATKTKAVHLSGSRSETLQSWLFVPDEAVLWLPFAIRLGLRAAREQPIDAIFSTSPRHSGHLVAWTLRKLLNQPWVADFRDPWVTNPFMLCPTRLHRAAHSCLERMVVRAADRVIAISDLLREDFLSRYPDEPADKFITITNGFSPEDFTGLLPAEKSDDGRLRIVHNGRLFYAGKDPRPFLQAVKLLAGDSRFPAEVILVGTAPRDLRPILDELGLEDIVRVYDFMPHRESLRYLLSADILLVVQGPGRTNLAAKTFEYLSTGKPILALAPRGGSVDQLLSEANVGLVIDSESPQEIAAGLLELIRRVREGEKPEPNWEFIRQFTRRNLTRRLVDCLDQLCGE